ncbi:MAG TPA: cobalamin biosynthesis protein [Candidatus Sulfotelmatobacter sp.]|nr:cobalamin biosynthesis protein [Candidatus Sulfotelmatobacter sp.]
MLFEALIAIVVLVLAIAVDLVFGDPAPWKPFKSYHNLHPTIWMGKFAKKLKPHFKNSNPQIEKINGVLLALVVIIVFSVPVFVGLGLLYIFLPFILNIVFYIIVGAIILKTTICIKLETDGAKGVARALDAGDLEEAKKYHHFSRRDPTNLTSSQMASAVIESMVENLTDFKHSPIIYYSFFGVSGAIAFRAINTLDGVVGFKDQENINLGWFSANLDTVVNYIPARLTTILMIISTAIIGEDWHNAWRIAQRDRKKIPSRNHGWQMAAIAGALHVQLDKPGYYSVGDTIETLNADKILKSLKIRDISIILSILLFIPVIIVVRLFVFPF